MKKAILLALLLGVAAAGGYSLGDSAMAAGKKGKDKGEKKWLEVDIGKIPNEFGDLVGFSGQPNNWGFLFKNSDGELRLVEYRGGKLPNRNFLITRKY